MADLGVTIAGVRFKNPIVLGSATPTMNWQCLKKGIAGGAGAGILKSLFGDSGKAGRRYPRPRFKLYDYKNYPGYPRKLPRSFTLHSLEDCSGYGYEAYMEDVNRAKEAVQDNGVVMASLSGATLEEWETMCSMVNETGADWVELNLSCPYAADMGIKMGAGAVDLAPAVTAACARILKKPFSVKISPQAGDPIAIAKKVESAGAHAINLAARLSGIMIDIDTARPVGWGSLGGYGGPYLLGYGLKWVSQAARVLSIPIIAGLGVWEWQDIIRYTMVGAHLVQSATAIMLQGYSVSSKWAEQINTWLDQKGYSSISEIRGIALEHIKTTAEVERCPEGVFARVNEQLCDRCGVCVRSCFYDAIKLTKGGAVVNRDKCDGCGLCAEVCPTGAAVLNG